MAKVSLAGVTIDHYTLYNSVRGRLLSWRRNGLISFDGTSADELCRLFNISDRYRIPEDGLRSLSGEHGLTIYKMLVCRRIEDA